VSLILASSSPFRKELLTKLGLELSTAEPIIYQLGLDVYFTVRLILNQSGLSECFVFQSPKNSKKI